ncbi:MAG: hypothetical protein WBQ26_03000 [Gemmatimonadaceae bacterium]
MNRHAIITGACALALGLAACSSNSDSVTSTAAFQLTPDDSLQAVVHSVGQATAGDLDVLNSSAATLNFQVAAPPVSSANAELAYDAGYAAAAGCTLDSATSIFTCPPTTSNGLTLVRTFEFFDSTGAPMLAFNGATTASVHIVATETGVRSSATGADTISRVRDLTASGLLGHNTTRIWNGTGTRNDGGYWSDSIATRTAHVIDNTTFTNIVVDLPRASNPYPASGTITRMVSGAATVTRNGTTRSLTVTRTVTITFNGTEFVPMMVGNTAYTLDLATGTATKH